VAKIVVTAADDHVISPEDAPPASDLIVVMDHEHDQLLTHHVVVEAIAKEEARAKVEVADQVVENPTLLNVEVINTNAAVTIANAADLEKDLVIMLTEARLLALVDVQIAAAMGIQIGIANRQRIRMSLLNEKDTKPRRKWTRNKAVNPKEVQTWYLMMQQLLQ